tara:strand:- start:41 stop:679 length:639 start_codon:yes stop_codon:yes gene_type:complete
MTDTMNIKTTYVHWGPYVMKTSLPKHIINKLKTEGKKAKESYSHKLAGHLDHQYLYPADVQRWFYDNMTPYIRAYRDGHCKYHNLENLMVELNADDLWVNYMKAGDFNPKHSHGGDYSFVLFLDVPKALEKEAKEFKGSGTKPGSLLFEFTQQAKPKYATTGHSVMPKTGDFYMFPAMLQHWVCPFKSKVTRISVSGNMRIINKDKLPRDYF